MIDSIIQSHKLQFDHALEHYRQELSTLRTGRANVGLLSTVMVESYGTKMPLQQVASITVSDARTLTISPWDKSQIQAIEKGIAAANLGFNPGNDGVVIRVTVPPLNEERRREMVKIVGQLAEAARISVRQVREDILKAVKKAEADGQVAKDDVSYAQKKVQEVVDKMNAEIKQVAEEKEKDIMTV
jgi:ribosome recycling factor